MSKPPTGALVPAGPSALSGLSHLAARTLAERAARANALTIARTLIVGSDGYATIGAAVADARDGDTVLIRPGTYEESVTITKAISVVGDGDRNRVIVEGPGAPAFVLDHTTAALSNLTIAGGAESPDAPEGSMLISGGAPLIDRLSLVGSGDKMRRGIVIGAAATPTIRGCAIRDMLFSAIEVNDGAGGTIESNEIFGGCLHGAITVTGAGTEPIIRNNAIRDVFWIGIHVEEGAGGTIESNEFFGAFFLGAIRVTDVGTDPTILKNSVHDGQGTGICVEDGASGTIEANEIFGQTWSKIFVGGTNTDPVIRKNTIRDGQGSGIFVHDGASGTIEAIEIFGNADPGIAVSDTGTDPVIRNNTIRSQSIGIFISKSADPTLEGNAFADCDEEVRRE